MNNCKLVCTYRPKNIYYLTEGSVYGVDSDGKLINDSGNKMDVSFYKTVEELNSIWTPQFELIDPNLSEFISKVHDDIQQVLEGTNSPECGMTFKFTTGVHMCDTDTRSYIKDVSKFIKNNPYASDLEYVDFTYDSKWDIITVYCWYRSKNYI